ncbi:MAG: 16S rRNA (guanine(966)-N(2))-methyltransferase RsmD [Candidatus Auribacter fodinae]|jgi:16S rRNA (guanine(966)-N(2))-methyltransferase RsmD|uniref:16S rRNA (Guanine(966)-N(2))-methyltransferase RsmD n=1 Tax=Candidatus Auribacter fodinae TaxID=2093366 RepID=A0A3A4QUY8_9BACT|nr:MAG: 16S rRNA (guanine(966)-N(2))-methyltransferase RsmD [Candidatus Auribacter fodinae]
MVRIIAGKWRSRKIVIPQASSIRPTSDRVKEALFSSLGEKVVDARVLDLFCGAGNLGLEALSRGARSSCFVENNTVCLRFLETNIRALECSESSRVVRSDAVRFIESYKSSENGFDIVFADPPYDIVTQLFTLHGNRNILQLMVEHGIVSGFTTIVLEHGAKFAIPESLNTIMSVKTRRYGDTAVSFFQLINKDYTQ